MENKNKRKPDVIDAEYQETEKSRDVITPVIHTKTQLVPDDKGNRLIWIAIFTGIVSFLLFLLTVVFL